MATDADGNYSTELPPSDAVGYTITVDPATIPENYLASGDPDAVLDLVTVTSQMLAGEAHMSADFGVVPPGSLGDLLFVDLDGNGALGLGEPGIAGVIVTVTGADILGNLVFETTQTNADGVYLFELPASNDDGYLVTIGAIPAHHVPTIDPDGVADSETEVVLAAGAFIDTADFGFVEVVDCSIGSVGINRQLSQVDGRCVQVSGKFWLDSDGDGVWGSDESAIEGAVVHLLDANGNVIASTTTDASGCYLFDNVAPGVYTVEFFDEQGRLVAAIGDGDVVSERATTTVTVGDQGEDINGIDALARDSFPQGPLAFTGFSGESQPLVPIAVALLTLGMILLGFSRRRRFGEQR